MIRGDITDKVAVSRAVKGDEDYIEVGK